MLGLKYIEILIFLLYNSYDDKIIKSKEVNK